MGSLSVAEARVRLFTHRNLFHSAEIGSGVSSVYGRNDLCYFVYDRYLLFTKVMMVLTRHMQMNREQLEMITLDVWENYDERS